jgi:hypothetical protein
VPTSIAAIKGLCSEGPCSEGIRSLDEWLPARLQLARGSVRAFSIRSYPYLVMMQGAEYPYQGTSQHEELT